MFGLGATVAEPCGVAASAGGWRAGPADVEAELVSMRTALEATQRGYSQLEAKLTLRLEQAVQRQVDDALVGDGPWQEFRQLLSRLQGDCRQLGAQVGRMPSARDVDGALEQHKVALEARIAERLRDLEHGVVRNQQVALERLEGRKGETWRACLQRMAALEDKAVLQTDVPRLVDRVMTELKRVGPEILGGSSQVSAIAEARTAIRRLESQVAGCEARLLGMSEETTTEGRVWRASVLAKIEAMERTQSDLSGRFAAVEAARAAAEEFSIKATEAAQLSAREAQERVAEAEVRIQDVCTASAERLERALRERTDALTSQVKSSAKITHSEVQALQQQLRSTESSLDALREEHFQLVRDRGETTDTLADVQAEISRLREKVVAAEASIKQTAERETHRQVTELRHALHEKFAQVEGRLDTHGATVAAQLASQDRRIHDTDKQLVELGEAKARVHALGAALGSQAGFGRQDSTGRGPPSQAASSHFSAPPRSAASAIQAVVTTPARSTHSAEVPRPATPGSVASAGARPAQPAQPLTPVAQPQPQVQAQPQPQQQPAAAVRARDRDQDAASVGSLQAGSSARPTAGAGADAAGQPGGSQVGRTPLQSPAQSHRSGASQDLRGGSKASAASGAAAGAALALQPAAAAAEVDAGDFGSCAGAAAAKPAVEQPRQEPQKPKPQPAAQARPAPPAGGGPPAVVLLVSPTYQRELAGEYDLVNGQLANNRPLWKKRGADRWLYFNTGNSWTVGGPSEKDQGFKCTNGWLIKHHQDPNAMPDAPGGTWMATDGAAWYQDAQIRVEVVGEPEVGTPRSILGSGFGSPIAGGSPSDDGAALAEDILRGVGDAGSHANSWDDGGSRRSSKASASTPARGGAAAARPAERPRGSAEQPAARSSALQDLGLDDDDSSPAFGQPAPAAGPRAGIGGAAGQDAMEVSVDSWDASGSFDHGAPPSGRGGSRPGSARQQPAAARQSSRQALAALGFDSENPSENAGSDWDD